MLDALAVNLRHLRALPAIAELGSMSAAAGAVGLSQPALAQGLAKLETHFGAPLFDRTPTGMRPTREGAIVLERTAAALARLAAAMRGARRGARRGSERVENLLTSTQIRALISLGEGGGFLGAAKLSGGSQPALHRAVRDLEAILGVSLAERRGQRVGLTEQGMRLVRQFRLAGADLVAAHQELATEDGGGHIAVGAMPLCRALLLPRAVGRMVAAAPAFQIDVAEGSYAELLEPLRDGRIEIAIGALRDPCPPDLAQTPLLVDRLAVAGRRGHPLAGKRAVTTEALAAYPWIIGRDGSPLRAHWESFVGARRPAAPIQCGSIMTIRGLLLEADFLTLLSPDQIALELSTGLLSVIDVAGPAQVRTIGIIQRSDWRPTKLQQQFVNLLHTAAALPKTE